MRTPSLDLPQIPEALTRRMAEIGPVWGSNVSGHVRETIALYSAVLAQTPREGISATRDIAYGKHARQVLDVHAPDGAGKNGPAPVVVFAHGGAFIEGDKERTPEVYANVLRRLARGGVVGVNMEYRLAPEFKYPAASDDVAGAVAWTRANIARFGGDPARIFLMGHSAGAAHTGAYAYDARRHGAGGPYLAGHIVVSGRVRAEMRPDNPNRAKVAAYYGDGADLDDCSAVSHINASSVPTMIAMAEFDNPLIDVHCMELAHRLSQAQNRAPRTLWLEGHNHTSIIAAMDTADDRLGSEILDFMRHGR
jgi:acetyl esterase/lipase